MHKMFYGLALTTLLSASALAGTGQVVRYPIPHSDFPIAAAVEVPAGKTMVYLSGNVAPVINPKAPKNSTAAYGDTRTQTIGTLTRIQEQLKALHLTMGDVVKMQVFLVGDPKHGGHMDFAGFMEGYTQFFGTKAHQPKLPVRSAVQVAGLAGPGFLVEIEVTAVRP